MKEETIEKIITIKITADNKVDLETWIDTLGFYCRQNGFKTIDTIKEGEQDKPRT